MEAVACSKCGDTEAYVYKCDCFIDWCEGCGPDHSCIDVSPQSKRPRTDTHETTNNERTKTDHDITKVIVVRHIEAETVEVITVTGWQNVPPVLDKELFALAYTCACASAEYDERVKNLVRALTGWQVKNKKIGDLFVAEIFTEVQQLKEKKLSVSIKTDDDFALLNRKLLNVCGLSVVFFNVD